MSRVDVEPTKDVSGAELLRRRTIYVEKLTPFAQGVIEEDGYLQNVLNELNPAQREVMVGIFAAYAGIQEFGRVTKELPYLRYGKRDFIREVDPIMNGYGKKLRAVGVKDPKEYLITGTLASVGEEIRTASRNDFSFDKP